MAFRALRILVLTSICLVACMGFTVVYGAGESASMTTESVSKLIEASSAARQVAESGNSSAQAKHEEARKLLRAALDAQSRDETDSVSDLLRQAFKTMFEAVKLADNTERSSVKKAADFDRRKISVEALATAYVRISKDKGAENGDKVESEIQSLIAHASDLRESGDVDKGREILDQAYNLAKTSIENLRGGDTLVRTLNFASKEEEYHYEIDRNDTHKMLITVLLKERLESESLRAMVTPFLNKAEDLRKSAESQAHLGHFEEAIRTLEDSTKNFVRAIRGAGVYIPG